MKKFLFLVLICISVFGKGNAQHDVKFNIIGLMYTNFGGAYEYVINDKSGVNLTFAYFNPPKTFRQLFFTDVVAQSLSVEYRVYYQEKKFPALGFWGAPYLKYSREVFDGIFNLDIVSSIFNLDHGGKNTVINSFSMGYCIGSKYSISEKLNYEWYFGLGGHFYQGGNLKNNRIQIRIGFNIAYRFAKK